MATLMREGSRKAREKVFFAAYDAGVRHFDVAPLYGLGEAEKELGRLLGRTEGNFTVATKFGLTASPSARALAKVQAPLRRVLAHSSRLRALARSSVGTAVPVAVPSPSDVLKSLEKSLHYLGVGHIDVLLLHDLPWGAPLRELWQESRRADWLPAVGSLGIAGDSNLLAAYPENVLAEASVLQTPPRVKLPAATGGDRVEINYGLLSTSLRSLGSWLDADSQRQKLVEELLEFPLRDVNERVSFLCSLALSRQGNSILLFGTTKPSRIRRVCEDVGHILPIIAQRRHELHNIIEGMQTAPNDSLMSRVFHEH